MPIDRIIRSGRVTELAAALALLILLVALAGCTADPRSATLTSPVPPTATTLRQLPPSASWPTDHTPASLPASSLTAQPPGTPTSSAEPAAEPPALPVIGSLGGSLGALAVAGDWAYLAEGQGLTVLDVHDPNQPQARGRLALSALIHDLAAAQGRVYVAAGEQGLLLINVDDPAHPVLSGRLAPSPLGNTQAVQLVGDLAYVVDGTGLRIADVHDAAHPVLLGSLDLVAPTDPSSWAVHLQVVGPFAYVALSAGGLAVVDIRAPAHPVLSGRYTARFVPTLQRPDSPGAVGNLQVVGHLAYLAAGDGGLEIVDVTDPSHPVLRGYQATPPQDPAVDVQVVDGLAYVIYAPDSAWGPRAPHLEVIDVGHPARPTTCARVDLPQVPVNLRIGDGRAYLTSASDLRIWDLAVPCGPSRRGHYMPLGPARDLQVVDGVAYVATSAGLQLVDVRDPARPLPLGRAGTNAVGVQLVGSLAYVAAGDDGLEIINVHDSAQPRLLGHVKVPSAGGVQVVGDYAYVACGMQGVQIVDIRDPIHLQLLSSYNRPYGEIHTIQVVGKIAYAADDFAGLQILDVHDPAHPVALASYKEPSLTPFGQVSGRFAYFIGKGLQIIDVHDPAHPVLAANYRPPEWAAPSEVQVEADRGYILDMVFPAYQVHVLDLLHPTTPVALDTYRVLALHEAPREGIGWQVVGYLVYIVGADEGLQIVEFPH